MIVLVRWRVRALTSSAKELSSCWSCSSFLRRRVFPLWTVRCSSTTFLASWHNEGKQPILFLINPVSPLITPIAVQQEVGRTYPYLLQVSYHLLSHPSILVGVLGGAGLSRPQSCLSLHQPAALPLQEDFGFLDGCAMWGDVASEPAHTDVREWGLRLNTHWCRLSQIVL